MSALFYLVACVILSIAVMVGIAFMSKVTTARLGNSISSVAMLLGIILILVHNQILAQWVIYVALFIGGAIGFTMAKRVKMIQMPQMVALLNGIGGAASAVVGIISALSDNTGSVYPMFERATAYLAIVIGMTTLVGSLVAAGKLHKVLPQRPLVWPFHSWGTSLSLIISFAFIVIGTVNAVGNPFWIVAGCFIFSSLFGLYFSVRVGGADMPITISLLNSLSGVAASIAGMAVGDVLLVSVGAIVGASGLLLTQIMCRAMNRSLMSILLGTGAKKITPKTVVKEAVKTEVQEIREEKKETKTAGSVLASAKNVIIVPGYGMALAQAQHQVKQLADKLADKGANVRYAIHPVAGRMPGHMNVLLCEADVPYEQQFAMEEINDDFEKADVAIVIGANDVLNPAARNAEGTPIYGMPVLNVDQCPEIIICNFDLKPGYAGVDNPIYSKEEGVFLKLGDAKESLKSLMEEMSQPGVEKASVAGAPSAAVAEKTAGSVLASAKNVIIVPGYGMALAQAQHQVKQLADKLADKGANVRYAIHPVAGRMPGHMNVLLCEADVPYEQQFAMEEINDDFEKADVAIVIGANDVLNPAARNAEGTPIYGMPVLNVDQCPEIIICNFDLKPGYAGVDNPIYSKEEGVFLKLGDAKESLKSLMEEMSQPGVEKASVAGAPSAAVAEKTAGSVLASAKNVIIVPGYGMALAQAQHQVKQLADKLADKGANVRYAIHPVAGRMPGHMNVLLCEADVPYEQQFAMEEINDDFEKADVAIVIGANDVLNPAARNAEGTPIYGMPVLNVDQCPEIIICNFDLKPGYAGVDNPIYAKEKGVYLFLGDAKESLKEISGTL